MMAPGTSSMLRARRRDVNVKPNRRLDRKSSRGMLYENEELRLRTININAEVERGQNDIKKLRRENEQLRREIWGLREEYDRLENLLGKAKGRSGQDDDDTDNGEGEEEDLEYDEEEDEEEDDEDEADLDNAENQQKASSTSSRTRRNSVRVLFDGLSVVDEETDEEATCDSANSKHKHEQQFFGKIKLPNGKEGVFMSDGMLPNSNGVQPCSWPEQSYYNYTFTPVDSSAPRNSAAQENDGFFGTVPTGEYFQRRGGPDVFISGAYPVTASPTSFPVGGNLDQLLKQMNGNENENTVQIAEPQVAQPEGNAQEDDPKDVQEVIDALEMQLDTKLEDAVKGVRVVNGNCFVCLNKENSVEALLRTGLTIRGEQLTLEEASRGYVLVSASGVPYDVSDDALAKALSQHCSVLGDIERRLYKGVDTGERVVKLKPLDAEIPSSITVSGSKIAVQVLKSTDVKDLGETCAKPENSAKPMENSFTTDRFRSQISVRLKQPNPKSNRSLDNIFDTSSPKQIHNTSLPIIGAYDNSSYIDQGRQAMIQDRAHNIGSVDTCFQPYSRNFLKDPPNIFSEIPIRKAQDQTLQLPNIMDDSTESVDVFTQPAHQFQSNPFVGNFPTSTPVTAVSVNPFIPSATYTSQPIHQYTSHEHQRQAFLPQTTSNARICSPYPFMNSPAQYAAHLPNSGIPSPNLTPQNSPQVNKTPYFPPENSNYLPNPVPPTNPPNPGFLIPASYYTGDVPSQPPNLSVSNPALNIIPAQQSSNAPSSQVNHSTQNIANEVKPHDVPDTVLDRSKHQSSSMPSSPITGRRKKPSILSHQHSKSSGDEGPRSSPGAARRKISRKQSSTNSIKSHHSVDASGGPNATSSPNTKHKTSVTHSRKTSGGVSSSGEATGGSQTNVVDVSRSSSSGQDSPTKPDRRRRVSIYFNKKGAAKRRDSVFVPNGGGAPGAGILTRSISLEAAQRCTGGSTTDVATGHSAGAETTTCSDRERTNSASSRTSSATGTSRLRKHSECSNRGSSIADVGKVPWCGCWGNGCL